MKIFWEISMHPRLRRVAPFVSFIAMLAHNRDDKLVGWGWDPGIGREAVPIPRAQFVAAFEEWMGLGAPCPAA
jgi:hypothetical protein